MKELTEIINKGIESGEFRRLDPELVTQSYSNMIADYCISQFALKQSRIEIDNIKDVVETFVDIFLNGICNTK